MRNLLLLLALIFSGIVRSNELTLEDKMVNYLVEYIELNEAQNQKFIDEGKPELVNRTIYLDYNQILEDKPRVLKVYVSEIADLTENYPKTKKSSDIFNSIQDQIQFYNVMIGAMPDYFKIIQDPYTYRYGQKINRTGGYYDSQSGYYSIDNYYGQHQEDLYKLMRNTLSRVSQEVEAGDNVVFNYFAFTKKKTPKKTVYINFVHTDFVGDLFVPHLQDLRTDLTGIMAAANTSIYSNSQYSIDDKLNYHLTASVKVLINKRNEQSSILESAILNSDPHDNYLPWDCQYHNEGAHIHGVHILGEFLDDNGFVDVTYPITSGNHFAIVKARQKQESGDYVEYEIELRQGMGQDSIWDLLSDWGVNNHYDYCCYRFGDSENRNFTDWLSWYDNYALDAPPLIVDLIARIIAAPFLSAYGYWYGTDALTGQELTGLDYVLNAFDLIPGVAAFSSSTKLGIKSIKLLDKSKIFLASSQQFISKIPTKLYTFVKTMSSKALALVPKATGELVVLARETSGAVVEIIEFGADQVIKILREIDPGLAPPQVVYSLGEVSVRNGDEIVQRELQIVKTGDGQVFVKSVKNISSKLNNYPRLLAWHNSNMPSNVIDQLDTWPTEKLAQLEADFVGGIEATIQQNPDYLTSWNRMYDADIPASIRSNIDALSEVDESLDEGLDAIDAIEDAIQLTPTSAPTWPEILARFKRGNDFNRKARDVYDYNEIVLANGKRLDSYIPGEKIISRKATDIDNITVQTWRNYCNELITKYQIGTPLNSSKLPGAPPLSGKYYLEIPASNLNANNLNNFLNIAKTEYGIEDILFLVE